MYSPDKYQISKIQKREGKESLQGNQQARIGREAKLMIKQDQLLWLGPGGGRTIKDEKRVRKRQLQSFYY